MFYLEEVMGRVMGWVGYSICSSVIWKTKLFAADAAKRVILCPVRAVLAAMGYCWVVACVAMVLAVSNYLMRARIDALISPWD